MRIKFTSELYSVVMSNQLIHVFLQPLIFEGEGYFSDGSFNERELINFSLLSLAVIPWKVLLSDECYRQKT